MTAGESGTTDEAETETLFAGTKLIALRGDNSDGTKQVRLEQGYEIRKGEYRTGGYALLMLKKKKKKSELTQGTSTHLIILLLVTL